METPFKPTVNLESLTPDVKSYVYQALTELEDFTTPNTVVVVTAKDPIKLLKSGDPTFASVDPDVLKKMWRISISLSEEGARIEEEAVHENIYEAIRLAKNKLLAVLTEIQDSAVSSSDRTMQINQILDAGHLH